MAAGLAKVLQTDVETLAQLALALHFRHFGADGVAVDIEDKQQAIGNRQQVILIIIISII